MKSGWKLLVAVHDAEFSKDYQYRILGEWNGSKAYTDWSAVTKAPIFQEHLLLFPLGEDTHALRGYINFAAQVLISSQNSQSNPIIRTLGECSLDISPFALIPGQKTNLPVRQQLRLLRAKEGKDATVGRFIASIKIIQNEMIQDHIKQLETRNLQKGDYFIPLPQYDAMMNFDWRLRVQVRNAKNIINSQGNSPQLYVETGWSQYKNNQPEQGRSLKTSVRPGSQPEWHQTLLIVNPNHMKNQGGFLMVALRDQLHLQDNIKAWLPIGSMTPFAPYNIKLKGHGSTPPQLYLSVVLQSPLNSQDTLIDIIVKDIIIEPVTSPLKNVALVLVVDNDRQPSLQFLSIEQDAIQRLMQFDQKQQFGYMMTAVLKVPISKGGTYKSACVLTVSEMLLRRRMSIFLATKQASKYKILAMAQGMQKDLGGMVVEKTKKKLFVSLKNHPNAKYGTCRLQLAPSQSSVDNQLTKSRTSDIARQSQSQRLIKQLKQQGFGKQLLQSNQIIARILKQLDSKGQALKHAGAQISDLRGRVKLLQSQNGVLRCKGARQEQQLGQLVQREVQGMSDRQLRQKIVRISQLYRSQRVRSNDLQRALRSLQPQVNSNMQLQSTISAQQNTIAALQTKLDRQTKEQQRLAVYKETIKKQQKVIGKLQSLLKEGAQQVRAARQTQIRSRDSRESSQVYSGNANQQIQRLQALVAELQRGGDNFQLKMQLEQARQRIKALEQQLMEKGRGYGRQIAMLKMKLAQKDALNDGLSSL